MDRFEQKSSATLELTIRVGGVLTDATGNVTLTVTDGGGGAILTDEVAEKPAGTAGTYQQALTPANLALLDVFKVVWKYTLGGAQHERVRYFMVVGSFHCTVADLHELRDGELTKYPDRKLVKYRELAEELLEDECDVAFSPQGRRLVLAGDDGLTMPLPTRRTRRLVSGRINDVVLTSTELAAIDVYKRELYREIGWPSGIRNVELYVEHGFDQPPERIREATKRLVLHQAESIESREDRTLTITNDLGTQQLAVPGRDGPTGIPYVDAVIERWTERDDEVGSIPITTSYR